MNGYRRLLIATDLDVEERAMVHVGQALGHALGSERTLVHAFTNEELGYAAALPVSLLRDTLESTRDKLEGWAAGRGQVVVRVGNPVEVVLAVAEELDADLIVLGTHARRGLGRALLGSVAESIMRRSRCAVLVVPRPRA